MIENVLAEIEDLAGEALSLRRVEAILGEQIFDKERISCARQVRKRRAQAIELVCAQRLVARLCLLEASFKHREKLIEDIEFVRSWRKRENMFERVDCKRSRFATYTAQRRPSLS